MIRITATFNVFGYQTREIDLTPLIGLALLGLVVVLLAQAQFNGG